MIHIIGGGTFSHVRSHMALAAPAFGGTARWLHNQFMIRHLAERGSSSLAPRLHLTKMADPDSKLVTNQDVGALIDQLVAEASTRVIIMNAAMCDFEGAIGDTTSGKYAERLRTSEGDQHMVLTPAAKVISGIRKVRKDIFLVAFKTTAGATPSKQYLAALNLLKANSVNLVLANDIVTRHNMIVAPEETRYHETTDRTTALEGLVQMVEDRRQNTFTRSTVVEGDSVPWSSDLIPSNLRSVVDYLIHRGAYKPFRGATAGHFAVRLGEGSCLTSKRKTNYNDLDQIGLVRIDYEGLDRVIAHGAKPSVGGQSQRIVFDQHPDLDCIVHAHIPLRPRPRDEVPVAQQAPFECGSHQCGANTSRNLREFSDLKAVMLDNHGPNIVFSRDTPAEKVIDFIEANWDVEAKTGGMVEEVV